MFKVNKNRQNNHANRTAGTKMVGFYAIMPQVKENNP